MKCSIISSPLLGLWMVGSSHLAVVSHSFVMLGTTRSFVNTNANTSKQQQQAQSVHPRQHKKRTPHSTSGENQCSAFPLWLTSSTAAASESGSSESHQNRRAFGSAISPLLATGGASLVEDATSTTTTPKNADTTTIMADDADFVKPDRDRRRYRHIRLANNLQVLLVSTSARDEQEDGEVPKAQVEAASVHIEAGHFDDTIPGLAHFHEHMLFLGTEKYPGEDEYEAFLSQYGGFGNAYTDMEDTNYYFSITTQKETNDDAKTTEGLAGALDRMAQLFIAPMFNQSMVERELRAIDSEYRNGKTSDAWRNFQYLKTIANPHHPFSNFGCGNYDTLTNGGKEPPLKQLQDFWKTYYSTSNMRLAVIGQSSLDALQETVEQTFGAVPYSNEPGRRLQMNSDKSAVFPREHAVYNPAFPAFGAAQLGKLREVIPLLESRSVKIQFATPPMDDPVLRKARPYRVISHLLGHEAPGSLHHLLNDLGYLTSLTSGTSIDTADFSLFGLTVTLTPKGMDHYEEVVSLVFQWLSMIRRVVLENPKRMAEYHDEMHQIAANNFKFRENGDPADFCSSAAQLLFDSVVPPGKLLHGTSRVDDYDPIVAEAFMDRLLPNNAMITVTNSGLNAEGENSGNSWLNEPLYGATYRESTLSEEQLTEWKYATGNVHPNLELPGINKYIPTDFSLRGDEHKNKDLDDEATRAASKKENPVIVHESDNFRMWHKMDRFWRVPKTFIRLSIVSPKAYETPRSMTLSRIFQRVLNDDLNSYVYDSTLAGCTYHVSCTPTGYKMSVRGYSEKLPALLDTLTSRMLSLIEEFREGKEQHPHLFEKFERAKQNLLRETKNYRLDTPYEVCSYNSRLLLEESVWFLDNYVDLLEGPSSERHPLTMQQCADVAEECLTGRVKANALCFGNIDEKGTQEVTKVIQNHFIDSSVSLNRAEAPKFRSMQLPTRDEAVRIFGPTASINAIPIKYQEVAHSSSEENNAVEMTFQVGSDLTLGYSGIGVLDLLAHLAYTSAYNQLRTKEQLGYIVSAHTRKTTGGGWGLTVVVQSSSHSPKHLEERIEAWVETFRRELEEMTLDRLEMEAGAIVGQLQEDVTTLSSEVSYAWSEIVATENKHDRMSTPAFDRLDRLADELTLCHEGDPTDSLTTLNGNTRKSSADLKSELLKVVEEHLLVDAPQRRALSCRVFNQTNQAEFDESLKETGVFSTYADMQFLKEFLPTWSTVPYWRTDNK